MDYAEVFKREYQRVGFATAMPECLDGLVELMYRRETRQYEPYTFGFLQREAHIFDEVLDEKSRIEVALKNTRTEMSKVQQAAAPPRMESSIRSRSSPAL